MPPVPIIPPRSYIETFSRRAMNKSFQESGGTVLSTNWSEVGKGQVDVKPPDGMEFKKWD